MLKNFRKCFKIFGPFTYLLTNPYWKKTLRPFWHFARASKFSLHFLTVQIWPVVHWENSKQTFWQPGKRIFARPAMSRVMCYGNRNTNTSGRARIWYFKNSQKTEEEEKPSQGPDAERSGRAFAAGTQNRKWKNFARAKAQNAKVFESFHELHSYP